MIYQELIIDGMSVDIPEDTDITLEITSNIFNDITEITTNRSYTISLPKTVRNLTLLGNCDKVGINSSVPYSFHTCEYRRNGVPIIRNGRATITECDDDISVNIYWGLFPLLEKLIEENKNINELSNDLHILFSRRNDISKYDDLQAKGYGYADYYPYKFAESEDDWSSGSYVQAESKTTNYELVEGKIYTGTEVGDTSSGGITEDEDYNCLAVDFTVGMKAQINNVVGLGDYRAYAILDSSGNVIEIAEKTAMSGTSKGDLTEESRTSYYSADYVFPRIKAAMHVDKIKYYIEGNGNSGTLEYGFIDATSNEVEVLGSVPVSGTISGIASITIDKDKPKGKYVFIRQTDSATHFLMGYFDFTGNSDLGRYDADKDRFTEVTNYNVCFKVYYTSTKYVPATYNITAPALAAKLVVNNNIIYSTDASVIITSSGRTNVPPSAWGIRNALQPVVTCWWVLQQIMADYGMTITWDNTAQSEIKGLAMPLVTRDADATTLTGGLEAKMISQTKLGTITIDIESLPTAFEQVTGEVTELTVDTDCTLQFDIQAYVEIEVTGEPTGTTTSAFDGNVIIVKYWLTQADYIKMTVTHSKSSGEEPDEYIVGPNDYDAALSLRINDYDIINGMYRTLLVGAGKIDLVEGDTIKFELLNTTGTHKGLRMYGGTITAQLVDNDEVPYGGQFPIVKNLGDISVTDYIKTLNLLSGTFPLQRFDNNTVTMATYNELWANKSKALDWTKKLIANGLRNKPRQITYSVDGYYQHNYYKWKEDDETKGNYDHDMKISNPTLEDENDAFEFPFAASNGNRVPLYTPRTGLTGSFAGSDKNATESETDSDGGTYSACEPRIMNLVKSADDKAALDFQINLDYIFNEKYGKLIRTVSKACVITEYLYLSDMEIMEFDERIPVYLAQYAAYFAVLNIKVASDGYSEVEMIKLDLEG